jgi:hypothetical protein
VVTTHALGAVSKKDGKDAFSETIPRNATLPRRASKRYTPATDTQIRINVQVREGDPKLSLDSPENFLLTQIRVPRQRAAPGRRMSSR